MIDKTGGKKNEKKRRKRGKVTVKAGLNVSQGVSCQCFCAAVC